jgi:hypothetical protein
MRPPSFSSTPSAHSSTRTVHQPLTENEIPSSLVADLPAPSSSQLHGPAAWASSVPRTHMASSFSASPSVLTSTTNSALPSALTTLQSQNAVQTASVSSASTPATQPVSGLFPTPTHSSASSSITTASSAFQALPTTQSNPVSSSSPSPPSSSPSLPTLLRSNSASGASPSSRPMEVVSPPPIVDQTTQSAADASGVSVEELRQRRLQRFQRN